MRVWAVGDGEWRLGVQGQTPYSLFSFSLFLFCTLVLRGGLRAVDARSPFCPVVSYIGLWCPRDGREVVDWYAPGAGIWVWCDTGDVCQGGRVSFEVRVEVDR